MAAIQMKELLEAGVHFGHQTKRWNPKMKKYIFGARNSIYIIDLQKTLRLWNQAANFLTKSASEGKTFLFVATKPQAQELIAEQAQRCGAFYVNNRWLGGMLTNFATIKKSLDKLKEIEATLNDPARTATLSKKEILTLTRSKEKLEASFAGIRDMRARARRDLRDRSRTGRTSPSPRRSSWASRSWAWWTPTATPTRSTT